MRTRHFLTLLGEAFLFAVAAFTAQDKSPDKSAAKATADEWRAMFDGKSLNGWKESPFVARGKVSVEAGKVILGTGYITGITWTKPFPTANYEIRYEAARIQGSDFFGAITFPVHKSFCTFVNGGWGGMVVGLSSLDLMDASENETMMLMNFNQGQWYKFRVRVTDYTIDVWIDEELVISVNFLGREVGLRPGEIENSKPLGLASYRTVGAVRKIEYRLLPPPREPSESTDSWQHELHLQPFPRRSSIR
jgi:hypothetical protein